MYMLSRSHDRPSLISAGLGFPELDIYLAYFGWAFLNLLASPPSSRGLGSQIHTGAAFGLT